MAATTRDDEDAAALALAVRRAGTSFYWAMRILPPVKRRAMFGVYAFCREVDDIADESGSLEEKRDGLAAWREEIDALFEGRPTRPISRALAGPVRSFGLRREDFLAVIDGMAMDASDRVRIGDMDELMLYCDRVACAVGRLSVRIFGVAQPEGDALAQAQGEALQLTNILRDLKEDAERDRLYLPAELLRRFGLTDLDAPEAVLRQGPIANVCEHLAHLACQRFEAARQLARQCDARAARPAVIMMEVYRRTLVRLIRRGWTRWAEPVDLPKAEKFWVALRYGVL